MESIIVKKIDLNFSNNQTSVDIDKIKDEIKNELKGKNVSIELLKVGMSIHSDFIFLPFLVIEKREARAYTV